MTNTRKTIRLPGWDYSTCGFYHITICTLNKSKILCDIINNTDFDNNIKIIPSDIGENVIKIWNNINEKTEFVKTDKFVLMPNHIHGILIIKNEYNANKNRNIGLESIIKEFKSITTRYYKSAKGTNSTLWQKGYYDHIIRDEKDYKNVWNYINNNPAKWSLDDYY